LWQLAITTFINPIVSLLSLRIHSRALGLEGHRSAPSGVPRRQCRSPARLEHADRWFCVGLTEFRCKPSSYGVGQAGDGHAKGSVRAFASSGGFAICVAARAAASDVPPRCNRDRERPRLSTLCAQSEHSAALRQCHENSAAGHCMCLCCSLKSTDPTFLTQGEKRARAMRVDQRSSRTPDQIKTTGVDVSESFAQTPRARRSARVQK
jgi:hypothetical protein